MPADLKQPAVSYARRVGLFTGTLMVVGGIIGSGIFLNPAIVAQRVGTAAGTLAVWVLGGVIAVLGAFVYGELGARRPRVGGPYAYLSEAFGALPAFLYGWTLLAVITTGAIAAVAVTFASYTTALLGLPERSIMPLALGAIVLLSVINIVGVAPGAITQNVFTLLKLGALALLIGAGLLLGGGPPAQTAELARPANMVLAIGAALVPVLFAYGGWQQTNMIAEELVDPVRTLPRALLFGVAIVVVVYLGANFVYLRVLGVSGLAASHAPAADAMTSLLGPTGRTIIATGIALSTFGFLDVVILVSPRVYQAMARDGHFFQAFAALHPRFRTPVLAIAAQGAWAAILTLSGTYGDLLDYVVFGDWIFFGLTAAALPVLRRQDRVAGAADPMFRAWAYPLSVVLFVAAAAYVVVGSVASNPGNAVRGTALMLLGIPVFLWSRRQHGRGLGID